MLFAKLPTSRPQGGTQHRWKDSVQNDLRLMRLEEGWSDLARQRNEWHARTQGAVKQWDKERNEKEEEAYHQKKAGIGLKCPRCDFIAKNEIGLRSHLGQKHRFDEESSDESDREKEKDSPTSSMASSEGSGGEKLPAAKISDTASDRTRPVMGVYSG